MGIRVRPARPGDGREVAEILGDAATPRSGLADTIDRGELKTDEAPVECYLVAYDDTATVGALGSSPPFNWLTELGQHGVPRNEQLRLATVIAKIYSVAVKPTFRRQGIGRKLVLRAVAFYREHQYEWIYGQFGDENLVVFYQGLGFEVSEPDQPLHVPLKIQRGMRGGPGGMRGDSGDRWFSMLL